jgi:HEAT repeat protein
MGIANLREPAALTVLARVARDRKRHRFERCAAVLGLALSNYPDGAQLDLLRRLALSATHTEIQAAALLALARTEDADSLAYLRKVLASRGESDFRRANAAAALGKSRSRDSILPLVEALGDGPITLRMSACLALGALLDRGGRLPGASPCPIEAGDEVGEAARATAVAALSNLVRKGGDPHLRAYAAISLGRIADPQGAALLRSCLTRPPSELRAAAALGLGLGGEGEATKEMLLFLQDASLPERDRAAAALALGILGEGGARVRRVLRECALGRRNADENVRAFGCVALGLLRDSASAGMLGHLVLSPRADAFHRIAAAYGLALVGTENGMKVLVEAHTRERNSELRAAFLRALGCSRCEKAPAFAVARLCEPMPSEDLSTAISAVGQLLSGTRPPHYAVLLSDRAFFLENESFRAVETLR